MCWTINITLAPLPVAHRARSHILSSLLRRFTNSHAVKYHGTLIMNNVRQCSRACVLALGNITCIDNRHSIAYRALNAEIDRTADINTSNVINPTIACQILDKLAIRIRVHHESSMHHSPTLNYYSALLSAVRWDEMRDAMSRSLATKMVRICSAAKIHCQPKQRIERQYIDGYVLQFRLLL